MKKIIIGMVFATLFFSQLSAKSIDPLDVIYGNRAISEAPSFEERMKSYEEKRRDSLSPEEKGVEDLEKENRLKRRQRDAQREKERLEAEERAEKEKEAEKDTTWGKVKGLFD